MVASVIKIQLRRKRSVRCATVDRVLEAGEGDGEDGTGEDERDKSETSEQNENAVSRSEKNGETAFHCGGKRLNRQIETCWNGTANIRDEV